MKYLKILKEVFLGHVENILNKDKNFKYKRVEKTISHSCIVYELVIQILVGENDTRII